MKRPEPVGVIKQRREGLLRTLVDGVPYIAFLGIRIKTQSGRCLPR